jgi:hypothetical protein
VQIVYVDVKAKDGFGQARLMESLADPDQMMTCLQESRILIRFQLHVFRQNCPAIRGDPTGMIGYRLYRINLFAVSRHHGFAIIVVTVAGLPELGNWIYLLCLKLSEKKMLPDFPLFSKYRQHLAQHTETAIEMSRQQQCSTATTLKRTRLKILEEASAIGVKTNEHERLHLLLALFSWPAYYYSTDGMDTKSQVARFLLFTEVYTQDIESRRDLWREEVLAGLLTFVPALMEPIAIHEAVARTTKTLYEAHSIKLHLDCPWSTFLESPYSMKEVMACLCINIPEQYHEQVTVFAILIYLQVRMDARMGRRLSECFPEWNSVELFGMLSTREVVMQLTLKPTDDLVSADAYCFQLEQMFRSLKCNEDLVAQVAWAM